MRRIWIPAAMIALCVGIGVGYRVGCAGAPPSGRVQGVRGQGAPDGPSPQASPETASSAPPSSAGQHLERPPVWGYDSASASASQGAKSEQVETTPAPIVPARGDAVSPTVSSPPLPAAAQAVPHPAKADDPQAVAPAIDRESDRQAPAVALFLHFDPPAIEAGGTATLSIGVTDDLSGVQSVSGTVQSPSHAAIIPFVAQETADGGVFAASITIPPQAEAGEWRVRTLLIIDKANNPANDSYPLATPPGGILRVASSESDSTAPNVRRVWVDKGAVGGGEKNRIHIDVDDDRSGVASITGAFEGPSSSAFVTFSCVPSGETSWVGDVPVPASAHCGEWTLEHLQVADKANNTANLTMDSQEVGRVSFSVSGGGCDSDAPVVDALSFAPSVVSNATASVLLLTAVVQDDGSGVGLLNGRIDGPVSEGGQVPKIFFTCQPDPKNPGAPLTAKITVPKFAASGFWRVTDVEVTDKAHNRRIYTLTDPVLAEAGFTVESTRASPERSSGVN